MTQSNYPGMGEFIIRVVSGGVAFPVEGAVVTVSGREENGMSGVVYSLRTDNSGLTPKISLPAPSGSLSLVPGTGVQPYSVYDIKVTKNGFLDSENAGVQIFDTITAIQTFQLIPQSFAGNGTRTNSPIPPSQGQDPQLKEVDKTDL